MTGPRIGARSCHARGTAAQALEPTPQAPARRDMRQRSVTCPALALSREWAAIRPPTSGRRSYCVACRRCGRAEHCVRWCFCSGHSALRRPRRRDAVRCAGPHHCALLGASSGTSAPLRWGQPICRGGNVGRTVMPHDLYLHSAPVQRHSEAAPADEHAFRWHIGCLDRWLAPQRVWTPSSKRMGGQ